MGAGLADWTHVDDSGRRRFPRGVHCLTTCLPFSAWGSYACSCFCPLCQPVTKYVQADVLIPSPHDCFSPPQFQGGGQSIDKFLSELRVVHMPLTTQVLHGHNQRLDCGCKMLSSPRDHPSSKEARPRLWQLRRQ